MWTMVAAVLIAGTLATFTDWLFMGVLFHSRYNLHPEIWREGIREGKERGAILLSSAFCYVTAAITIGLCELAGAHDIKSTLIVGALAWAAGPLGVVVANGLFVKFDPLVSTMHALGYLARFAIAAVAASIVLS